MGEMWVERFMRMVSSTECRKSPEATLAIRHQLTAAIEDAKVRLGMDLDEEAIPRYTPRNGKENDICFDSGDENGCRLTGKGNRMSKSDIMWARQTEKDPTKKDGHEETLQLMKKFAADHGERTQKDVQVYVHDRALIRGITNVKSFLSKSESRRRSYFATVKLKDEGKRSHVAMIHQFVRLSGVKYKREERYALCAVYDGQECREDEKNGIFIVDEVEGGKIFKRRCVAVPLEDIGSKCTCFETSWTDRRPHFVYLDDGNRMRI